MSDNFFKIQTTFYAPQPYGNRPRKEIKSNLSKYARSAVLRAIDRMQLDYYGANFCEVFDTNTAELHAMIWRGINGSITVQFKRDSKLYILGGLYKVKQEGAC